jgi:hypothetical protein
MAVGVRLVLAPSAVRPRIWHPSRSKASPWDDRVFGLLWEQLTSAPVQMALASALTAWLAGRGKRHHTTSAQPFGGVAPQRTQNNATASGTTPDIA